MKAHIPRGYFRSILFFTAITMVSVAWRDTWQFICLCFPKGEEQGCCWWLIWHLAYFAEFDISKNFTLQGLDRQTTPEWFCLSQWKSHSGMWEGQDFFSLAAHNFFHYLSLKVKQAMPNSQDFTYKAGKKGYPCSDSQHRRWQANSFASWRNIIYMKNRSVA